MKRREFTAGAIAAIGGGLPAFAHDRTALDAAIRDHALPADMMPATVRIKASFAPYEIHVDPNLFMLYWTLPDGMAIRYAVGIGRKGLYEPGEYRIRARREWPSWRPTPDMIQREPDRYGPFAEDGMKGGIDNPLGARALYLFDAAGRDTYLRIHGTSDPSTLKRAVSNGCARLINSQMVDLYRRVPMDTRVVLYPQGTA